MNEPLSGLHDAAPCQTVLLYSVLEMGFLLDNLVGQQVPLEEKGLDLILIGTNQRSNGFGDGLLQHWWYVHSTFSRVAQPNPLEMLFTLACLLQNSVQVVLILLALE